MKRTILVGVMGLVMLAACSSKQAPQSNVDDEDRPPAAPASTQPAKPVEPPAAPNPAEQAAGMSKLIEASPQCQTYLDQLQAASKGPPGAATSDAMSKVVKAAFAAGCGHRMSQQ